MLSPPTLRPRTSDRFAALMELYERNYMLVRLLAPALGSMSGTRTSTVDGELALEMRDIEHGRYTTTFRLTYRLSRRDALGRRGREPNLAIRLYHDARTCEVMSGLMPGETGEERRVRDLDEGHRLNRFLNRWLGYCLERGHGFEGARRRERPRGGAAVVGGDPTAGGRGTGDGGGAGDVLGADERRD